MDARLRRLSTETALRQYIELWTQLNQFQLTDQEDSIIWRFAADGQYSATSAYAVQFAGTFADERWNMIWKAKLESKCRFFAWLLLQLRLPTSDRIIRRGGQAQPICKLCHTREESILHMMAKCSYATELWQKIAQWSNFTLPANGHRTTANWWASMVQAGGSSRELHLQPGTYGRNAAVGSSTIKH